MHLLLGEIYFWKLSKPSTVLPQWCVYPGSPQTWQVLTLAQEPFTVQSCQFRDLGHQSPHIKGQIESTDGDYKITEALSAIGEIAPSYFM